MEVTVGLLLETIVRVHPDTAVQRVGQKLLAATSDNRLHTFEAPDGSVSEVGERIIELVDGVRTVGDIIGILEREFEVSRAVAEADTRRFIAMLIEKRVLSVG